MVTFVKGSRMLVFMADQMALALNTGKPRDGARIARFDGEADREWCQSMFTIAYCQI